MGNIILVECENGVVSKITTDFPGCMKDHLSALVVNKNITLYHGEERNYHTEEITINYDALYVSDNIPEDLF